MPPLIDTRWVGPHGIGRFAREIVTRFPGPTRGLRGGPGVLHPLEPLWLSGILLRQSPPVFFSPGFNAPLWAHVPVVFTIHDMVHLRFAQEGSPTKRAYYRAVVRPAAKRAYRILTVSEFSRREILDWSGLAEERVVVVGNGVSEAFVPQGPQYDPGYPYILYVGNRKPHKNFSRLLQAFAGSGIVDSAYLVVTGRPSYEEIAEARRLKIASRISFTGVIGDEELSAYYRGATALTMPSLYEGFGLPALEAMACGTPVLASKVTALPEVVGDAALTVDPYEVEAIAQGLERLVENSELRATLRPRGLKRAAQFTWEGAAARAWQVLKEAMEAG